MPSTTRRTRSSTSRALGCDFLACSAYKFYGPHVGVLYGRHELLEELDVPKLDPAPNEPPERLETGTQNHEGIVGAGAAVEFLASLAGGQATRRARLDASLPELHARGQALVEQLWDGLQRIAGVRVYGPPPGTRRAPRPSRSPCAGTASEDVARRWPSEASSSRTATSTPPPSSRGSARRMTVWSAPAAPATRRRMR